MKLKIKVDYKEKVAFLFEPKSVKHLQSFFHFRVHLFILTRFLWQLHFFPQIRCVCSDMSSFPLLTSFMYPRKSFFFAVLILFYILFRLGLWISFLLIVGYSASALVAQNEKSAKLSLNSRRARYIQCRINNLVKYMKPALLLPRYGRSSRKDFSL